MTWLWIAGGLVLLGAAVVPPALARRRTGRREYVAARDRAHSAMSRLEWALDAVGGADAGTDRAVPAPEALARARRCYTLAGSALAGQDTADGFRQAESWAREGLSALGEAPDVGA